MWPTASRYWANRGNSVKTRCESALFSLLHWPTANAYWANRETALISAARAYMRDALAHSFPDFFPVHTRVARSAREKREKIETVGRWANSVFDALLPGEIDALG